MEESSSASNDSTKDHPIPAPRSKAVPNNLASGNPAEGSAATEAAATPESSNTNEKPDKTIEVLESNNPASGSPEKENPEKTNTVPEPKNIVSGSPEKENPDKTIAVLEPKDIANGGPPKENPDTTIAVPGGLAQDLKNGAPPVQQNLMNLRMRIRATFLALIMFNCGVFIYQQFNS